MRINTNVSAMSAQRGASRNAWRMDKNLEKLSSGLRVNRASDDAAGLQISERMEAQVRGVGQAQRNALDGMSILQVAEGGLQEIHAVLQRMRELAVQSANGVLTTTDRRSLNSEFLALRSEINNIACYTSFNGRNVLSVNQNVDLQVGAFRGQTLRVQFRRVRTNDLTINNLQVNTQDRAQRALLSLDRAVARISELRSSYGASINRLEHTINNLSVTQENVAQAKSRIRETDMAHETSELTRNQILLRSSTAMLAQANSKPASVLQLFS